MKKMIFWIKNCLLEDNRGCSGFCGTCKYYHLCSNDGLDKENGDSSKIPVSIYVNKSYR